MLGAFRILGSIGFAETHSYRLLATDFVVSVQPALI